jgi:hypothetical protein
MSYMTSSVLRKGILLATLALLASCSLPFGGSSGGGSNNNGPSSTSTPGGPGIAADKTLNSEFWYAGFHITLGKVTYFPEVKITPGSDFNKEDAKLTIEAKFENLSPDTRTFFAETSVASNGQQYTRRSADAKIPNVPGKATSNGQFGFAADAKFNLDDAIMTVGEASTNQAVIPLGSKGSLVNLAPRNLSITGAITMPADFTLNFTGAALSYDVPEDADPLNTGIQLLKLNFSITGTGDHGCCLSRDDFSLKVPDGTAISASKLSNSGGIPPKGTTKQDLFVEFQLKAPVEGAYDMVVNGNATGATGDLPFTITPGGSNSGTGSNTGPQPSTTASAH